MRARIAAIAASMAALAASTPIVAAPAQAADGWSVGITTTKAIAYADSRFRSDGHWVWFRPRFTVRTTVVCPVGETAALYYRPVAGNQSPYTSSFSCTGAPQVISVSPVTPTKGDASVRVALLRAGDAVGDPPSVIQAETTRTIKITAIQLK